MGARRIALLARPEAGKSTQARRLAVYDRDMAPVLDWHERAGTLVRVDGEGDPAQVAARIAAAIG